MSKYTPRGTALHHASTHRGITEQPAGSNSDHRQDGIRSAQVRCAGGGTWLVGQPWCGVWCWAHLKAAGVKNLTSRLASVGLIEDDARARRGCFRKWTTDPHEVLRGDLVVLFGRGIHVELVREINYKRRYVITDGGNTSSGNGGSQDNGGGAFRRIRSFNDVHGYACVDYPGN